MAKKRKSKRNPDATPSANPVTSPEFPAARADAMPAPRKMGRPTLLTPEVVSKIIELLRAGNYFETACASAGVSAVTAREWLRFGAADREKGKATSHARFSEQVEIAQAEGEARLVTIVANAAIKDWKAGAFILERKFPNRWSERVESDRGASSSREVELERALRDAHASVKK